MPQTEPLFFESVNEVLRHTVQARGGFKKVGPLLRGDRSIDAAAQWLRDCLNVDRNERMDPEQLEALVRLGREGGCHAYMHYMAATLGYSVPSPLSQEDVKAHASAEAMRAIAEIAAIYNRLQKQGIRLEDLAGAAAS